MKELYEYLFKKVRIITTDGETYEGEVDLYSSAEDSGDDEDSIGICTDEITKDGIGIFKSEIASIEEI